MKNHHLALIVVILLLFPISGIRPVVSQFSSDIPKRITINGSFEAGMVTEGGEFNAVLRNHGWSTYRIIGGFPVADLFYATKIDFENRFDNINFSGIEDWQIYENYNNSFDHVTPIDFTLTIEMEDSTVAISYSGILYENYCNYEDACLFIDMVFDTLNDIRNKAPIVIPQATSILTMLFVILAISLPVYFSARSSRRQTKKWMYFIEILALLINFYILFDLIMFIFVQDNILRPYVRYFVGGFFEPYFAFLGALFGGSIVYRIYYKIFWMTKDNDLGDKTASGEVENQ